ncbi:probable 5-methylcytosine-specific restriction enzyme B [Rhodococcus jostii RHA1]|uniref:Probable 5-methylcytosine-specific restriction enzyme B n=1 Tax=Rhodococcus jostii (strain RHA1) TaxID=101510 RepID=Q0S9P7_RHOJR|nr:probable 5-methylcytosine-specific restriction enzyme B [Rhodococcus jostii RHA1]
MRSATRHRHPPTTSQPPRTSSQRTTVPRRQCGKSHRSTSSPTSLPMALSSTFNSWKRMIEAVKSKKNIIWQGPPGTGKTWLARRLGWVLCNEPHSDRMTLLQFHPSMSYEDFVRGFRPGSDGKLTLIDGPLLTAAQNARQDFRTRLRRGHRGDQPRQSRTDLRRDAHPARTRQARPRERAEPRLPAGQGRTVSSVLEPAPHRHDERRGPVPGPGRHGATAETCLLRSGAGVQRCLARVRHRTRLQRIGR